MAPATARTGDRPLRATESRQLPANRGHYLTLRAGCAYTKRAPAWLRSAAARGDVDARGAAREQNVNARGAAREQDEARWTPR
jgi:hypothetical protein